VVDFCLDSGVFIRPHRDGFYGFRLAPTFWGLLDDRAAAGEVAAPRQVYQELTNYGDELADWVGVRRDSGLFVDPDQQVQTVFTQVADYVNQNYPGRKAAEFLGGADPWVIAHAIEENATIVSFENRASIDSQTPKIPNVARAFQTETIDLYRMLQLLNVRVVFA
jgi:hypothetical protein